MSTKPTKTKAVFFTINKNKKLKAREITLNGNFSENDVLDYLKTKYNSSNNQFYLLLDIA